MHIFQVLQETTHIRSGRNITLKKIKKIDSLRSNVLFHALLRPSGRYGSLPAVLAYPYRYCGAKSFVVPQRPSRLRD